MTTEHRYILPLNATPALRALLMGALLLALGACQAHQVSVTLLDTFPEPLVEALPGAVGVVFTPEFSSFTHHEARANGHGGEWTINAGATQLQVFRKIFSSLFTSYRELDSVQSAGSDLTAVIVPQVKEFQFALPSDTKANVFEIWIKYDLSIRDREGGEIGHWVFTAYGKTPTAFMTSSEAAIQAATVVALRDAGASMLSGLERDARIREWLGIPTKQTPQAPPKQAAR